MSDWGSSLHSYPTAQTNGHDSGEQPVTLLVIGEPQRVQGLYAAFLGDARFQVLATATTSEDVRAKLAMEPETVVAEGTVFHGPEALAAAFAACRSVVFILLPQGVQSSHVDVIRGLAPVQEVIVGEANFATLAGQLYAAVQARRQARRVSSGGQALFAGNHPPAITMTGWRAVAVWSPQGGVGKSTIATALAFEAASRRLPALLIGLGAPDPIPLANGLRPEPNLVTWQTSPTVETLRASVQKLDVLDVLTGFPDPLSLATYLPNALDGTGSLPALTGCAAHAGYAVVVLDVSAQELAAAAISAANTLVLVGLPTLPGVLAATEAVHLVNDVMAGQHRIARQAIHLVVNKVRDSTLRPDEVVKTGAEVRKDFPSLAATMPDDPQIEIALNQRRPAYYHSEPLRRLTRVLGDLLFASPALAAAKHEERLGRPARVFTLGPLRIKTS